MNNDTTFMELNLPAELQRAIDKMGFINATDIQAQTIPLILSGADVIGRSQTGTGKTVAFGIPALQKIDPEVIRPSVQVLILCPTRELAMQARGEIKRLAEYMPGVKTTDVYGGAPMDRQILKLRSANLVVGTPGRVMDHMRRGTLKLQNLRMLVLDEADEMLSMGFREDIETILREAPEDRQTVLFSATMPSSILAITREYQKDPKLVELVYKQATVDSIDQLYYDVPMGRKSDALALVLRYHNPALSMVFCNTKSMVDDVVERLSSKGFSVVGLHGDMKQTQRTQVMDAFKQGRASVLVATDVAARGIDVSDINYVVNYDIPQSSEYYVHRVGRTGRAGKSGVAVTFCSGRRQVEQLMMIGRMTKSKITPCQLPKADDIAKQLEQRQIEQVEAAIAQLQASPDAVLETFAQKGVSAATLAAALWEMQFGSARQQLEELTIAAPTQRAAGEIVGYGMLALNIGRSSRVAPNHIVGAITERTGISGKEVGKIEIYDDHCTVGIPTDLLETVLVAMSNMKICGKPVTAVLQESHTTRAVPRGGFGRGGKPGFKGGDRKAGYKGGHRHAVDEVSKDYRRLPKKAVKQ